MKHPAKYSDALLPIFAEWLANCDKVLDPFAGTGKLRQVRPDAYLIELEPEWARMAKAVQGNALTLPFDYATFDAVCTSPTYGNRMADHHNAKDASRRNTYRHTIGHELHPDNSGAMQWGEEYKAFHLAAWREIYRVLKPGGRFVLNVSDHIRKGQRIPVTQFHAGTLTGMGFDLLDCREVVTPRQRMGENGGLRVESETVFLFGKGE